MSSFIANVVTRRLPISGRRVTVHDVSCRYVRLPMRRYAISAAEVLRLHTRIRRGDGGVVKICKTCRPDVQAALREDPT